MKEIVKYEEFQEISERLENALRDEIKRAMKKDGRVKEKKIIGLLAIALMSIKTVFFDEPENGKEMIHDYFATITNRLLDIMDEEI